jgi:hypothetical protein
VIEYLKLENVADERGEEPAKVARTLVRLGCDLYLHFGPSRKSRSGVSFYPEHPIVQMEHNIGPGDHPLTKDSQEAVIKRLDRGDTSTSGLTVIEVSPNEVSQKLVLSCDEIVELDPKPEVLKFQIELKEQDDSVCVVVNPDDVAKLPPPSKYQTAPVTVYPAPPEKKYFENSVKETTSGKRKPHTFYIATEKIAGIKRGVSWNKLKRLASESKGAKQIELNGFGKIYLKRDRENPETVLRYKHTEFERADDGNQITKGAFDMAWSSEKQSKKKGNLKET